MARNFRWKDSGVDPSRRKFLNDLDAESKGRHDVGEFRTKSGEYKQLPSDGDAFVDCPPTMVRHASPIKQRGKDAASDIDILAELKDI